MRVGNLKAPRKSSDVESSGGRCKRLVEAGIRFGKIRGCGHVGGEGSMYDESIPEKVEGSSALFVPSSRPDMAELFRRD